MNESIVMKKAYAFAIRIVKLYKFMATEYKEFVLSKQLLRSGTAIGALIKEAEHAESKADFLHKMNIALKEANETEYWLTLLKDSDYLEKRYFESLHPEILELVKLLASIVKSTKQSLKKLKVEN